MTYPMKIANLQFILFALDINFFAPTNSTADPDLRD